MTGGGGTTLVGAAGGLDGDAGGFFSGTAAEVGGGA